MLPEQSLLICTSPRSGSNWLCDLIAQSSQFGKPDEYFSVSSERFYKRQLGADSIRRYPVVFDYILRLGLTPNRRFASKLFWTQLGELETYFHVCGEFVGQDGLSILKDQLPNLRILRLTRQDRLRQAISHYRALRTNIWWKHKDIPVPQDDQCAFDYQKIRDLLLSIEKWEAGWDARLKRLPVPQLSVTYEIMRAKLQPTLSEVWAFLNISPIPEFATGETSFQVQSDAITDDWVRRFVLLDGGRTSRDIGRDISPGCGLLASAAIRPSRTIRMDPVTGMPEVGRIEGSSAEHPVYVQRNFLSSEDCDTLVECMKRNRNLCPRQKPDSIFDSRFLWLSTLPAQEDAARQIMQTARRHLSAKLRSLFRLERDLYAETTQIVVWQAGQSQQPHADNAYPGSRVHPTPHRDYAAIVYLNEGFSGGELYFPGLNITVAPETGTLVLFGCNMAYTHGVHPIVEGERYTMPSWFTHDITRSSSRELEAA